MKIDLDYIKRVLQAFEDSLEPVTDIMELQKLGLNYEDDQFLFHMSILNDKGLIERENGTGIGFQRGSSGDGCWTVCALRMTAEGYDFLAAMNKDSVWTTLKSKFGKESIGLIVTVAKELSVKLATSQLP